MGLFDGLKRSVGMKVITDLLKSAGEGKYGPNVQKVYGFFAVHALWMGIVLGASDAVLCYLSSNGQCPSCGSYVTYIGYAAGVLANAGLCVGFHAAPPPSK